MLNVTHTSQLTMYNQSCIYRQRKQQAKQSLLILFSINGALTDTLWALICPRTIRGTHFSAVH